MKRTLIALAALALLLPLGARTNAQDTNAPAHSAGHRPGDSLLPSPVVEALALSPDQKSQYDTLKTQYQQEREAWLKAHQTDLDVIQAEMLLARQANNQDKMADLRKQEHEAKQPLYDLRKQYVDKVRDFLTDDQKDKLDKIFPQWKAGPGGPTPAG